MYPNITLTTPSTSLSATLFTPDAARGYYRSTRFDHGSMLGELLYDGHTLDGPRPLWAYNLYCERETLSAEPIQLVDIGPGERATLKLELRLGSARHRASGWSWRRFAFVPG